MRKYLLSLSLLALLSGPVLADWTGKDASGNTITFKNPNTCSSSICVPTAQPVDGTGAAFGVTGNPFFLSFGTGVTLPAYASTPTFNLGTLNGAGTAANQATIITALATLHTDNATTVAAINSAVPVMVNGTPTALTGVTPGVAQTGTKVDLNTDLSSINGVAAVADPCQTAAKVYTPVNVVTATNVIITAVSAKKKYICGIFLYPGGTDNIAVYQATTATSCATAAADIFGGHTASTGFLATATAGFVVGNGASAIAATNTVNTDICITTSAAVQLSGVVVTVDQ